MLKRLRIKLEREFRKWSDKFRKRGMKFSLDDKNQVYLMWGRYGGRFVLLQNDFTMTSKSYKDNLSDVPLPILRASIEFWLHEETKEKIREKNN